MSAAEVGVLCGAILGVAAVLGLIWRVTKSAYRLARRIERIEERSMQLVANSGSSLYDRIHQTHGEVHRQGERLDRIEQVQADHAEKIHRNQGRIEAIALVTSPTMLIEDEEGKIRESRGESQDG